MVLALPSGVGGVSTHSRPKAAGSTNNRKRSTRLSFNTQPPEGGWLANRFYSDLNRMFQHTAARRRLENCINSGVYQLLFQHTAARRRLGFCLPSASNFSLVSTHSRPKAAGFSHRTTASGSPVSTHSRPKAAGLGDGQHANL